MRESMEILWDWGQILGNYRFDFNDLSFYWFTFQIPAFGWGMLILLAITKDLRFEPHQTDSLKNHKKVGMVVCFLDGFCGSEMIFLKYLRRLISFFYFPQHTSQVIWIWLFFVYISICLNLIIPFFQDYFTPSSFTSIIFQLYYLLCTLSNSYMGNKTVLGDSWW